MAFIAGLRTLKPKSLRSSAILIINTASYQLAELAYVRLSDADLAGFADGVVVAG